MMNRNAHPSYWAFIGHRISGVALAAFLPFHFYALGLALTSEHALDGFLKFGDMPLVKVAEWGLVVMLSLHLLFGMRVLMIEFSMARDNDEPTSLRLAWIAPATLIALILGTTYLARAW